MLFCTISVGVPFKLRILGQLPYNPRYCAKKFFNIPDSLRHIIVRKRVKIIPHSCERKVPHLRERKNCEGMVKWTCTCIFTLKRYWEFH